MYISNEVVFKKLIVVFVCFFIDTLHAQPNLVTVDATTQRFIGPVSEIDRSKFFVIHSAPFASKPIPVSYTHLTLPTILRV